MLNKHGTIELESMSDEKNETSTRIETSAGVENIMSEAMYTRYDPLESLCYT